MRLLHTSDWHLGHSLYEYDRRSEQQAMLQRIREITAAARPDLFLVCGDVFDVSQPSATTQRMFADAMTELALENPGMTIIVGAGNHDSGSRIEVFQRPWRLMNIHVSGNISRNNPDDHIIHVAGKAVVIVIPYTHVRNMPEGFTAELLQRAGKLADGRLPVVMMAHTTINGSDFAGHDNNIPNVVGGIESVDISEFGEGYDYLALGHIHRPQTMFDGRVRYSGSPLPVSFDETYSHSVTIADIDAHGETPVITTEEILPDIPLVSIPDRAWAPWEEVIGMLKNYPPDLESYIRLNIEIEDFLPATAKMQIHEAIKEKRCRFCLINPRRKEKTGAGELKLTIQEFQNLSPLEIFTRYAEDTGIPIDGRMKEMFEESRLKSRAVSPD